MKREIHNRIYKLRMTRVLICAILIFLYGFFAAQRGLPCINSSVYAETVSIVKEEDRVPDVDSKYLLPVGAKMHYLKPAPFAPEVVSPETLLLDWENPSSLVNISKHADGSVVKKYSDGGSIQYQVLKDNKVVNYSPDYALAFASGDTYSELEGVTTFRGNNYRNAPSFGKRDVKEKKLEIVWTHDVGAIAAMDSYWPGSGWTGQPILAHWSEDVRNMMNIVPEMKAKDLVEVIYPILDGNVYFLDLETGKPTRKKIEIGFPIKGTGMVDPRGYPLFYTGMGVNENNGRYTEFKYFVFNLIDQTEAFTLKMRDPVAYRSWSASDSSAVLNRLTDTLIEPGENGIVYKIKMNTEFDREKAAIKVSPEIEKYRYKSSYCGDQGIESSAAYYRNLMFFSDNGGTVQCLDINKMEPVWILNSEDDSDSTIVVDEETESDVFIYTANQVDKRCQWTNKKTAPASIRKINALTGELMWQKDYTSYYRSYINGGILGTPILGKDDISDLIIYPVCFTGSTLDGKLVALDKKTGEEVWVRNLSAYSWSSPVDFLSSDGKTYGIFCDFAGDMHLFDPSTGEDLDVISLGGNIESSPAVYNDMIVVGSYARKIFGIKIK